MIEIEILGIFVAIFIGLAFFNLYLLLHFLNRKGNIIKKIPFSFSYSFFCVCTYVELSTLSKT